MTAPLLHFMMHASRRKMTLIKYTLSRPYYKYFSIFLLFFGCFWVCFVVVPPSFSMKSPAAEPCRDRQEHDRAHRLALAFLHLFRCSKPKAWGPHGTSKKRRKKTWKNPLVNVYVTMEHHHFVRENSL